MTKTHTSDIRLLGHYALRTYAFSAHQKGVSFRFRNVPVKIDLQCKTAPVDRSSLRRRYGDVQQVLIDVAEKVAWALEFLFGREGAELPVDVLYVHLLPSSSFGYFRRASFMGGECMNLANDMRRCEEHCIDLSCLVKVRWNLLLRETTRSTQTLFHELVHFHQYVTGRSQQLPSGARLWEGKEAPDRYDQRPGEIEANEMSRLMLFCFSGWRHNRVSIEGLRSVMRSCNQGAEWWERPIAKVASLKANVIASLMAQGVFPASPQPDYYHRPLPLMRLERNP